MKYPVLDGHCDTAVELWRKGESLAKNSGQISLAQAAEFPAYVQFFAFCTVWIKNAQTDEERFASAMAYFSEQLREHNIPLCRTSADVSAILQNGGVGAALSIEGAGGVRLRSGTAGGAGRARRADDCAGVECGECAGRLLHDRRRIDGAGARIRAAAQRAGIIVDVSHSSERAFWDICEIAEKPIVASHSNAKAVCGHVRNLTDEQFPRDLRSWRHGGAESLRAVFERVRPRVDGRCAPPPRTLFRAGRRRPSGARRRSGRLRCAPGRDARAARLCAAGKQILKIGASASRSSGNLFYQSLEKVVKLCIM